jgi:hypothetical protein
LRTLFMQMCFMSVVWDIIANICCAFFFTKYKCWLPYYCRYDWYQVLWYLFYDFLLLVLYKVLCIQNRK